ncbi:hypothetical protein [Herbinix luporum]|uniref:Uncharacterized protein n=1 Tax=Herbinix luporum TaxID=1679721 RepID=A0A0K8J448_9FIRM|nr:hypothetical protein [Herbinix luporum]MDI9488874.1 hypothetical protein [Bacillota bacterium]CUH92134.1 hypothetical protein SD1D_0583 [Herbinix luporum]HHT57483.1 hypothetical protein [Herbinix luporum]
MGQVIMTYMLIFFITMNTPLSPMEALDLVKEKYACNFIKSSIEDNLTDYYYKLDFGDYYLVYEDRDKISGSYLIHLYEFVLDDIDTGLGHTVTYGWYWVNPYTGAIEVYNDGLEGN